MSKLKISVKMVSPDDLTPNNLLPNVEPSASLVKNVESLGAIIQSIAVHPVANGRTTHKYDVDAGARRLKAARINGIKKVPILIIEGSDTALQACITLTENNIRARNVLADIVSIRSLIQEGMTREEIASTWAIPLPLIDSRLKLWDELIPALREKLRSGMIGEQVAVAASQLDVKQQRKANVLSDEKSKESTRLTLADIAALKVIDVDKPLAELDLDIFKPQVNEKEVKKWHVTLKKTKWADVKPEVLAQVMALIS